jgi:deoxycytidine triphosphate deaminase
MEGIAQCIFFQSENPPLMPYNKKNGKYMHQTGITLAKIEII